MTSDAALTGTADTQNHPVPTRRLGTSDLEVSLIGLGCNNFGMKIDAARSADVVHAALDVGITHFDTAEMYGGGESEVHLAAALGRHRGEVTIGTKFLARPAGVAYQPGSLAARIREGCELSLRRLQTDYIDLFYQHHPDPEAPPEEALEALDALVREGKVRYLASSNVNAAQIAVSAAVSNEHRWARFVGTQTEWSLLARDEEQTTIPKARELGLGIVPYFPLASGLLSGKYVRGQAAPLDTRLSDERFAKGVLNDANFDRVEALSAFAVERGHSVLELALAWLAAQPGVASVIAGATRPEQVRANAAAASWQLTAADLRAVDDLLA